MSRNSMSDVCDNLPSAIGVRRKLPLLALIAIAIGLGGLGIAAVTSDSQFAQGLESALAQAPAGGAIQQASSPFALAANRSAPPVSGSEAFWLDNPATTAAPIHPATWRQRAISRGDRFQFGGDRGHRILEVTDVRQVPHQAESTEAASRDAAPLMMITLRDIASPLATPLRMLVDADSPIAGLIPLERARQADL